MSVFFHKYVHGSMYVNPDMWGWGGVLVCSCARGSYTLSATPSFYVLTSFMLSWCSHSFLCTVYPRANIYQHTSGGSRCYPLH